MASKKSSKTNSNDNESNNTNNYHYESYSKQSSQTSLKGGFSTLTGGFGGYHGAVSSDKLSLSESQRLDPQIEFCLKRLTKKDSITKLKALEDLRKLFETLSIDKLEAAASAWAFAFNRLSLVNDRRIRENLHLCFEPFCRQISVNKAKWFTPHLKRIFTFWWIHQHDPSPEVVEAAYNSFYASFGKNESRHWKVINYAKEAMLNEMSYILDVNTTPETLSNHIKKSTQNQSKKVSKKQQSASKKKVKSSKENIERYERVICSTLCGLATLIAKENEMENDKNKKKKKEKKKWWFEEYRGLLCKADLWRFINDKSPSLRNSAYLLIASCLSNGEIAKELMPLIAPTLFRCMSETYMPNMDNLWTALLAMVQYDECWQYAKKKSFVNRLCNLVQIDIFTSCKFIRSFLLFSPSNYLFDASSTKDDEQSDADSCVKKKKKRKKTKKNKEDNSLYAIVKILKNVWSGVLNISHLNKRFKAVTMIYFKLILQLLVNENNAKCDDDEYKMNNDGQQKNVIDKTCKECIIKENVINLICKNFKDLDCPSLFFQILGEFFLPKIVKYEQNKDNIECILKNEFYADIIVKIVHCIFDLIHDDFIEPFSDLMTLAENDDKMSMSEDDMQEICEKTEDFVSDFCVGIHKVSAFIIYLKPFVQIENEFYSEWNKENSVKLKMYEMMNEMWDFQISIELINELKKDQTKMEKTASMEEEEDNSNGIDTDSEDENDENAQDEEIKINFFKLFVSDPHKVSFDVCSQSLSLIQDILQILCMDFGQLSAKYFEFDSFLNEEIMKEGIIYILTDLQTKIPTQHSAKFMKIMLQIVDFVLNANTNFDATPFWKSFIEIMSNYEWSMKNMSIFIEEIMLKNAEKFSKNDTLLPLFEAFVTKWIEKFLNVKSAQNEILSASTTIAYKQETTKIMNVNKTTTAIAAESYTSLIESLEKLFGLTSISGISSKCLLEIITNIIKYIDVLIEVAKNPKCSASYPGITKNKSHAIIRSLGGFLSTKWGKDGNELSTLQLIIVSKLFTLCFARCDHEDPFNIAIVIEFMFKKIVRHNKDLYGELLETIAKSLRLPWYFTHNPLNENKKVPTHYCPSSLSDKEEHTVPIDVNRCNPTRWRWCVQILLVIQSTDFEHGLFLINLILDKTDLQRIFALSLADIAQQNDALNELNEFGVSLLTLQRCRDVICDLCDLIGSELILYEPTHSEYTHAAMLSTEQLNGCRRQWLICWLLSFEEKLSWLPLSTLPDPSIIEHIKSWKHEMSKYQSDEYQQFKERLGFKASETHSSQQQQPSSQRFAFAKPRSFSALFYKQLLNKHPTQNEAKNVDVKSGKKLYEITQSFLNECIFHAAHSSFYCEQCPIDIRSRVIGYFVNALNERMSIYNYTNVRFLDDGLRTFCAKLFSSNNKEKEEQNIDGLIENIQIMQSVFVMFPDFIPISFIRHLIELCTFYRQQITKLTTDSTNDDENDELKTEEIIKNLHILSKLLQPIHGIALNITNEYQTPNTFDEESDTHYEKSMIWVKHREYLVGALFELFLYLNASFEWFLQQIEQKKDYILCTEFDKDVFFWFSSSLTLISHSLIGMNSEGEQDVFFELDWSSLIFVSNFVLDHILHSRAEFTLCLHSHLSEFYSFLLIASKQNNDEFGINNDNLAILNNIDCEYRSNMMTIWHCMAVLRQIALRSRDLSGRKNLKSKKNKLFIFESLELLTEILGNEIWRNLLCSQALASPFHKLPSTEYRVEELVYMHYVNRSNAKLSQPQTLSRNFSVQSGLMSNSLSVISEQNEVKSETDSEKNIMSECYVNVTPSYRIHVILDSLYYSIHDLLNHPVVMSGKNNLISPKVSGSTSPSSTQSSININKSLCDILQTWHYQLFDALGSSHHQIVASAFRILSISTRFHVLKNIHKFSKKEDKKQSQSVTLTPNHSIIDISENAEIESVKVYANEKDNIPTLNVFDLQNIPDDDDSDMDNDNNSDDIMSNSDAVSVASTSVSFAMSYHYNKGSNFQKKSKKHHRHLNSHITKKDRVKFQRIHGLINSIVPTMYLLPHNSRSYVPWHELRSWFLSWYLFMNMVEESPLEFKLQIVQTMKHDHKYTSPLGSYSLALREIIEHIHICQSMPLCMKQFVAQMNANQTKQKMFEFNFDLSDFDTNLPNDDPKITANFMTRCRWLQQMTGNVKNKKIFFSNLAIRVYDRMLIYFPALCRYWCCNDIRERVTRSIVSNLTSEQFSPIILKNIFNAKKLNRHLKDLRKNNYNNSSFRLDDEVVLKLKCNLQSREIEALYICDEVQISMVALYPFDFPLKQVEFSWKETCGLPPKKVKNWQMLLRGMVNNQNAQITEAFMLLSINIYQHYKGIDECPICYSVVHPTKKTLPKVKCATCKGKFHRYCIYKWTKTSQKSTCPLCRSLI